MRYRLVVNAKPERLSSYVTPIPNSVLRYAMRLAAKGDVTIYRKGKPLERIEYAP